jgi:hypothetical protein
LNHLVHLLLVQERHLYFVGYIRMKVGLRYGIEPALFHAQLETVIADAAELASPGKVRLAAQADGSTLERNQRIGNRHAILIGDADSNLVRGRRRLRLRRVSQRHQRQAYQ